jgi:hypothetical protein
VFERRGIVEGAPKDAVVVFMYLADQRGSQACLAYASHTQDCYEVTAVIDHPSLQSGQFLIASIELFSVRSLTPVDAMVLLDWRWKEARVALLVLL